MYFYDFEVFKYDWLVVFKQDDGAETDIINDRQALIKFYEEHKNELSIGYNIKHYDQYIYKGIMLGMNPKEINDYIIVQGGNGYNFSRAFNSIRLLQYDVMQKQQGLKTLEGFMGLKIKESDIPFDIDRKLTEEEIQETLEYCRHDVNSTIKVFIENVSDFNTFFNLYNLYSDILNVNDLSETGARITSKIMQCERNEYDDEFNYFFNPNLRIEKYKNVLEWFEERKGNKSKLDSKDYYADSLEIDVAGVPHTFGFGGLHGAPDKPIILEGGAIFHVDVNNYYPSMLIAWGLITRSARNNNYTNIYNIRKELKMKQLSAKTKEEKKKYKEMQMPYKLVLNALSGAMKDKTSNAYDPRNNNCMCINGQLMLLDLIEHLEVIPGFMLIQSNTDGLIIKIEDTDKAFDMLDDICYEWETRFSTEKAEIKLAFEQIERIYQGDVNNYLFVDVDGNVTKIGAYVKDLSETDYDLPIINKAIVNKLLYNISVEDTINKCNELKEFQKIVKLSKNYDYVEHENGTDKEHYTYKCYRVFASNRTEDGRLLKVKKEKETGEKFANTSDKCFIDNEDVNGKLIPNYLDKQWYIELANKRLLDKFNVK